MYSMSQQWPWRLDRLLPELHLPEVDDPRAGEGGPPPRDQVSRSEWWHILVVIIPDNLTSTDTTMLWMTDGDNHDDFQPDLSDYNLLAAGEIAAANGVVTSSLFQVLAEWSPHQGDHHHGYQQ